MAPHPQTPTLGQHIRETRNALDLKAVDVAKRAGVQAATLCRIEADIHEPTLDTLRRIATALGVSLPTLIAGTQAVGAKEG